MIRVVLFLHVRDVLSGRVTRKGFTYDMASEAALPAVLQDIDRALAKRGERRCG